jgi:hypothetical protein
MAESREAQSEFSLQNILLRSTQFTDLSLDICNSVLKALCLGAKGVGLGRSTFYSQACYGEEGIARVFQSRSEPLLPVIWSDKI